MGECRERVSAPYPPLDGHRLPTQRLEQLNPVVVVDRRAADGRNGQVALPRRDRFENTRIKGEWMELRAPPQVTKTLDIVGQRRQYRIVECKTPVVGNRGGYLSDQEPGASPMRRKEPAADAVGRLIDDGLGPVLLELPSEDIIEPVVSCVEPMEERPQESFDMPQRGLAGPTEGENANAACR